MLELAELAEQAGHAFTACLLGDPVGAAGVVLREHGIGEAWALFSPLAKNGFGKSLFAAVKHGLDEIIEETGVKTLVSLVDPKDEAAVRFISHLGFHMKQHLYERKC